MEVLPVFVDRERSRVLSWSRYANQFFIFVFDLCRKGITDFRPKMGDLVVARPWIFVVDGPDQRTGNHHPLSALSEGETLFGTVCEVIGEVVRVRRWRVR